MISLRIVCLLGMIARHDCFSFPNANISRRIDQTNHVSHLLQTNTKRDHMHQVTKLHVSEEQMNEESTIYYSPNAPLDESDDFEDLNKIIDSTTDDDKGPSNRDDKELAFFDEATIYVRGGSGGQGSSTYKRGKGGSDGIPDGGDGGKGGDVIMVADYTLNTLAGLTLGWRPNSFGGSGASYKQADSQKSNSSARIKSFRASTGSDGGRQFDNGKNGESVEIRVPPGTVVQHEIDIKNDDGEVIDTELVKIGVVTSENSRLVIANGGSGGDGSGATRRAAAKGQKRRRQPPASGDRKKIQLELKLVGDIALVGKPNAGKSTFLAAVTRAKSLD